MRISRYRWLALVVLTLACQLAAARMPAYALPSLVDAVHAKHQNVAHVAVESSNAVALSETKPQEQSKHNAPIKSDSASAHVAHFGELAQYREVASTDSRKHITYKLWLLHRALLL